MGVFGTQLGTAIGFILPPLCVTNHDNIDDIGDDLYVLTCMLAGAIILVAIAAVICKLQCILMITYTCMLCDVT